MISTGMSGNYNYLHWKGR